MSNLSYIVLFSMIGGVFSLVGGMILLWKEALARKLSIYLISFAGGALLGAAFLELIPESLEIGETLAIESSTVIIFTLLGFLIAFLIEGLLLQIHHHVNNHHTGHEHDHGTLDTRPWLLLIGDSIHNFVDGFAITASFLASIPLGIATSLVVAAHEIPQEIGDFSIMIHAGWKKWRVVFWNIASALLTTVGALAAYAARDFLTPYIPHLLAGTAGLFIFIAASDILPEFGHANHFEKRWRITPIFFTGILLIWILGKYLAE
jgi:zinc and cadmium transporter